MSPASRPSAGSRRPAVGEVPGWRDLRHGGLLLDGQRLADLGQYAPTGPLDGRAEQRLRRHADADDASALVKLVLEQVCGFDHRTGSWTRGAKVDREWGRRAVTGEVVRPWQLWRGPGGARLPVFREPGLRVGIGKGRRTVSQVLGWLRAGNDHLALVTNGRQWRLLFAGLDFDAWCEWDRDLWFEEGRLTPQVDALRTLLQPKLWTPGSDDAAPPLLQAVRDTRKGQAELSETLGERVREAVETLIQGHGEVLKEQCADVDPADIYRAACRVAMRLVVILFAESRDLLPRDNALYHASYGLNGLLERLQAGGAHGSLTRRRSAWPQVLALFELVRTGSHFPQLPVTTYGGELFEPGRDADDGLSRALAVFETGCLEHDVLPDSDVRDMLERMTRTRTRIRQGRGGTWVTVPVDFSDLSSDYIGILYEGLLDYELKTAAPGEPVIFLAAGNHPALPLSRLEAMDDKAVKTLFGNLKKDVSDDDGPTETNADEAEGAAGPLFDESGADADPAADQDPRHTNRTRAETWARRAARVAGLVRKPRGKLTPERRLKADADLGRTARKLVARVVLPGEWYLVRWGGTRKGSGSFYTRPGLVVPTVQRTLRPLAYDPPVGEDGEPDRDAPAAKWTPKRPEQILELQVCDPACGSGAFILSALRFLTDALFASLQHHERIQPDGERTMVRLLGADADSGSHGDRLGDELVPCPPDHDDFEPRLKAVLRRHVVERCIYAVDLDPLAVELCRLSLWIETMDRTLPFGFLDHKVKCGNSLIGAWFDQFAHYPVMAWKNRQGGDQNHTNGVHFEKNARTKAIKAFVKDKLTPDLQLFLREPDLFLGDHLKRHREAHSKARMVLERMHELPVQDAAARARVYRDEFVAPEWRSIKDAMDLWCACWFWPADEIECAPLPTTLADPLPETRETARRVSQQTRFFHWELEFPDVFRQASSGFDAMLGNPPWDTAKPNSHEFFSNIDPLYRTYGKQEANRKQVAYFAHAHSGPMVEYDWIEYNARFRAQSNYVKFAARPFGDPNRAKGSADRFAIGHGKMSSTLHNSWRSVRQHSDRFADARHPFRWQGPADLNLYKMFLETAHILAKPSGRLGFVVPSGLYSDYGTRPLRMLFLEHCSWEWLFGIENRDKIFPIHRSYKFNPVVIEKGGSTQAISTAFMRRKVDDWEQADGSAIPYTRSQVEQLSPKSQAILEIRSKRDLEVLEKIYANGVLLGDDGPDGWGIQYTREFDMTNDSKLFPPRPQWEANGYRPDEYSRWLQGNWCPIGELWAELGVDPSRPVAAEVELEEWLFDTTAGPDRREAEARFVHGHVLKPGDVARTNWQLRCAQPPYDRLPVPRATIPRGVILSRKGDEWIREEDVGDTALPLYEGRMIGQFDFSEEGWWSGKGRSAIWKDVPWTRKHIEPQFLMDTVQASVVGPGPKVAVMDITSSTNSRTMIASLLSGVPCAHSIGVLKCRDDAQKCRLLAAVLNSWLYDFTIRMRLSGLHTSWFILEETPVLLHTHDWRSVQMIDSLVASIDNRVGLGRPTESPLTEHERLRLRIMLDVLVSMAFGLSADDLCHILRECDVPRPTDRSASLHPKGFWRIDKQSPPELRQTVLTLIAFRDLQNKIKDCDDDRVKGIEAFLSQDNGEWLIPERIRLADYGLGHDERAKHRQPVASRLGPRFYDWQLVQSQEEAWQECRLHARNLRGIEEDAELSYTISRGRSCEEGVVRKTRQPMMIAAERGAKYPSDIFGAGSP